MFTFFFYLNFVLNLNSFKMTNTKLINDLITRTQHILQQATSLQSHSDEILNFKSDAKSWSILECLEHLNRYGKFYLPEIAYRIRTTKHEAVQTFKTGCLGNYFAKSMLPKKRLNKMNSPTSMNPLGSDLSRETLIVFIRQQEEMLELLNRARKINLNKTKTSISISKWIKLRLGDTFRVVIYHNQRHFAQIEKVLLQLKNNRSYS